MRVLSRLGNSMLGFMRSSWCRAGTEVETELDAHVWVNQRSLYRLNKAGSKTTKTLYRCGSYPGFGGENMQA